VVTKNYSFRGRKRETRKFDLKAKSFHGAECFFMELTDPHVMKNHTEVSALTPLAAHILFSILMNPNASKPVKYDWKKSKFFYLWNKKFHIFIQKTGGNSEALILKYISSFCIRYYGK
jgi:hypothetical protein